MRALDFDEITQIDDKYFAKETMILVTNRGKTYNIADIESYSKDEICLCINDGYMCNYYTIFREDYNKDEIVIDTVQ